MHNVRMIVRREYLERVRKKSFWIGTLLFPAIMLVLVALPAVLVSLRSAEQKTLALIDGTGALEEPLREALETRTLKDGTPEYVLESVPVTGDLEAARRLQEERVASGEIYGVLVLADDPFSKDFAKLYARNVGNVQVLRAVDSAVENAAVGLRLERSAVTMERETLARITASVELATFQVSSGGETTRKGFGQAYFGTFAFVLMLYVTMLVYGVTMMRGVLEEKTSRVMEVLLGSVSPEELMSGKILGIGLVGLTQMGIYAVTAAVLRLWLGGGGADAAGDLAAITEAMTPLKLAFFLLYFLLGYFLYAALFAAVGAVCNSEEEAQNLQTPLVMCLVLPMVATIYFVGNPDSPAAVVSSLFPLFTPMVMYMRISVLMPPAWQIVLSVALTGGTIWLLFRGVAKVFRIGILMYGKRPTIPEIFRWARS